MDSKCSSLSVLLTPPAPPASYTLSLHDALPISQEIIEADADYVLALKGNHETVHAEVKTFLDETVAETSKPRPVGTKLIQEGDRKSTRLNSSHQIISYAVFCLKKKKNDHKNRDV